MQTKTIGATQWTARGGGVAIQLGAESAELDRAALRELMGFLREALEEGVNERHAARVPVFASSGVTAVIHTDTGEHPATLRNISLTGALLDCATVMNHGLKTGGQARLHLSFEGESLDLQVEVQRRAGTGFGLHFPESLRDGELSPSPVLERLVATLQDRHARRLHRAAE